MYVFDLGCVFIPNHVCVFLGVTIAIVFCKKADVSNWTLNFPRINFCPVCSTRVLGVSPFCASSI